jgi:hypothetical protein
MSIRKSDNKHARLNVEESHVDRIGEFFSLVFQERLQQYIFGNLKV